MSYKLGFLYWLKDVADALQQNAHYCVEPMKDSKLFTDINSGNGHDIYPFIKIPVGNCTKKLSCLA